MKELEMRNGEVVDADEIPPGILKIMDDDLPDEELARLKEKIRAVKDADSDDLTALDEVDDDAD